MSSLSTAELAAMRNTANQAQPDTAVISRATLASDGMGGYTETWATVETASCRLDPPGNVRLDQWSEKIQNRSVFILNVEAGTDIQSGDKATLNGTIYLVIGVLTRSWEITRQAIVVES